MSSNCRCRAALLVVLACLPAPQAARAEGKDEVLFDFRDPAAVRDWAPVRLPGLAQDQPAPKVEIVPAKGPSKGNALRITFAGGDWPAVATTKLPVAGDWKSFQTFKAVLTVDRTGVAYFRIGQSKPDEKGVPGYWEQTVILQPGRNEMTFMIRRGISRSVLDPARGDVVSFTIGMFRPEKDQTLQVADVRLSPDWPPPKVLGWYSPYNHDGYSSAVTRDYERTGAVPAFKVLGTDLEVANLSDLAKQLKDRWKQPEPKTIEQVEADFRAEYERLRKTHPKAVLSVFRDGETGWDPARPEKVYAGWKMVYVNSHGPDGPNPGRENTPPLGETVEVFMRHRSVLMRADLSSLPADANVLSARLVVTRTTGSGDRKPPDKPNLWVAEPCNRDWDETAANCYFYARGKHWKGVNGLYYGEDPDYWPVFVAHGPAGGGAVSVWDFTEAVKFWRDGRHANHGFYLHGDSVDYMRMFTSRAREVKQRPAVLVIWEPRG
jgi:hypothetical protein